MGISNIRFGFATNSSSTHSVVILKNKHETVKWSRGSGFHWSNFVLSDKDSKMIYLASQIAKKIPYNDEIKELAVASILNVDPSYYKDNYGYFIESVDHQSVWDLPFEPDKTVNADYINFLKDLLADDDVVVLGGNDGSPHPLQSDVLKTLDIGYVWSHDAESNIKIRHDLKYNFYTLFNKQNGTKIRTSKNKVIRSTFPELVDLKITNYCNKGCSYCYQDSNPDSAKNYPSELRNIIYALSSLGVFEIAIGGGEPTAVDFFPTIVQEIKNGGMVPNFSTRNLEFLNSVDGALVMKDVGGCAFSVDNADDLEKNIKKLSELNKKYDHKISIQYIVGNPDIDSYEQLKKINKIMKENAMFKLTILGFKACGRAKGKAFIKDDNFVDILKGSILNISVDTKLVEKYDKELDKIDKRRILRSSTEGAFSMYIDATTNTMGPSSFCSPEQMKKIDITENLQKQIYQCFSGFEINE